MKNKKMFIALITAAVMLMTGFVFAESLTYREEGLFNRGPQMGFFGGMRGHHWRDAEGSFFGGPGHCYFSEEDRGDLDVEEYRKLWLEERFEAIDRGVEAGEISEQEAEEYKEILEERSLRFEEEGNFNSGPGRGRGRNRGHMW